MTDAGISVVSTATDEFTTTVSALFARAENTSASRRKKRLFGAGNVSVSVVTVVTRICLRVSAGS